MKKAALTLCFIVNLICVHASHLMGGQITSRNIGGKTYQITLTLYRDTRGVAINSTAPINYYDSNDTLIVSNQVPINSSTNIGNGIEEYFYIDTVTFPTIGKYKITWHDCCRNAAIVNFEPPDYQNFLLENELLVDPTNSSPKFLNRPVFFAPINQPYVYNPLPYDIDGDSLFWSLDTPLTIPISDGFGGFEPPPIYTTPSSDPGMPFTMNPNTGQISFKPNRTGYFVTSVLVREFRNGVEIGIIRRDYQIIITNATVTPPIIIISSNASGPSSSALILSTDSTFRLTATAEVSARNFLEIEAIGEPLLLSNPPLVQVSNDTSLASLSMEWGNNDMFRREKPYTMVLRVTQTQNQLRFITDYTIQLFLNSGVLSVSELQKDNFRFEVYPNPSDGNFNISYHSESPEDGEMNIYSLKGEKIFNQKINLKKGEHLIKFAEKNISSGYYNLQLISNKKLLSKSLIIK